MKQIPTITEIRDNILADLKAKLYSDKAGIPMLERSVWRILSTAFAGVISSCYQNARYIYRQLFTSTANISSLELKGEQYGIFLKIGSRSEMEVQFTGEAFSEIPKNTQLISNGSVYLTKDTYKINVSGLAIGEIIAVENGESSVRALGDSINIMTPVAGVAEIAVVITIIRKGEDPESSDSFRNRIQTFERSRPQGGAVPDFINWSLEVEGVAKAFIARSNAVPRVVSVYPLLASSGENRIPDQIKLDEVSTYLNDPKRCPPCVVEVLPADELIVDVVIQSVNPVSNSLKALIENAWRDYIYSRYPNQYVYEATPNDFLDNSGLISTALLVGASAIDLNITITGARSTPYQLKINEIAKLGAVEWRL